MACLTQYWITRARYRSVPTGDELNFSNRVQYSRLHVMVEAHATARLNRAP